MVMEHTKAFGGRSKKPFRLIEVLVALKWKIFILGSVLFALLSPLAFLLYDTFYVASATVRISPTVTTFLSPSEDYNISSYYHDYVRTQVQRITRLQVLMTAINRLPVGLRQQFINEEEETLLQASSRLQSQLSVSQIPHTHLVRIAIRGDQAEGLSEIVNNVVNVYLEKLVEEGQGVDSHRLTYLQQEKRQLESQLAKFNERLKQISVETGISDFDQGESLALVKLTQLQHAYISARTATMQAQNQLNNAVKEAENVADIRLQAAVEQETVKDPILANARLWSQSEIRSIRTRMLGYSQQNPERRHLSAKMQGVQDLLTSLEEDVKEKTQASIKKRQDLNTQQVLIRAKYAYRVALENEESVAGELAEARKEAAVHSQAIMEGKQLDFEIQRLQDLLQKLEQRIYALHIESKAPGRTSLDSIARSIPHNNLVKFLIGFFALSFGGATAFFVFRQSRNQLISSPQDVELAIGASPSWPIQDYHKVGKLHRPFSRVTLDDPTSRPAMAIRSLAVKVNKERCNFGARLAVFTGIGREVGTTAIALNCAHAMRQLCDKVLIIEMNAQNPRLGRLVGKRDKPNNMNILDAMDEGNSIADFIAHDKEREIDILTGLPSGGLPALNRGKLVALIHQLKREYDFIIVDTAPLLNSDLTEFMIIQSDLIVPIILGDYTTYREAYDTIRLMLRLEVRALAPVLNWRKLDTFSAPLNRQRPKKRKRPLMTCRPMLRMRVRMKEWKRMREERL